MKLNFKIIVVILLFLSKNMNGQATEVNEVLFNYYHSLSLSELQITITKQQQDFQVQVYHSKIIDYKYSKENENKVIEEKRNTYTISYEKYNNILLSLYKISPLDLTRKLSLGLDGYSTTLSFSSGSNSVSYKVFSVEMEDKKTDLKHYLNTCLLILKAGKISPEKFFN